MDRNTECNELYDFEYYDENLEYDEFVDITETKKSEKGFIYITNETNSDGKLLTHNGLAKIGIGFTGELKKRSRQHNASSKNTTGVNFIYSYDCDKIDIDASVIEAKLHEYVERIGFEMVSRSHYDGYTDKESRTEVFTGKSNKTIYKIVKKGEEISKNLLKRILMNITNDDLFKRTLYLKIHQEDTRIFIDYKFRHGIYEILLYHICRSGKTFIIYDYLICNKQDEFANNQDTLLLTSFPILNSQWKNGLEMLLGHDYNIIVCTDVKQIILDKNRPNFVLLSLQDIKNGKGLLKNKFQNIKDKNWDLLIIDEVHRGVETKKTEDILDNIKYKKLIGLSATASKNLVRGTFSIDNTHVFSLLDEYKYKNNDKYKKHYTNPSINYLLLHIQGYAEKVTRSFKTEDGFSFTKLFEVEKGKLKNETSIHEMFMWFFCKGLNYNKKDNATFDVVNRSKSILLFVEHNYSQKLICDMLTQMVGNQYCVYYTNSDVNDSNALLKKIQTEFIPRDGKKVIVIANKQLTTGVTMKFCDCVVFMNDWKSLPEWLQASQRGRTAMDDKDECFVVDLNPSRGYRMLYEHIEEIARTKNENVTKIIKEFLVCAPIFENCANSLELKEVDFEHFKQGLIESNDLDGNFFNMSLINTQEIKNYENKLTKLGNLENVGFGYKLTQVNTSSPASCKNYKTKQKSASKKSIKKLTDICIRNTEFLLGRIHVLCTSTRFKEDDMHSIFEYLDKNEEQRKEMLDNIFIQNIIDKTNGENIYTSNEIYNVLKEVYKSSIFDCNTLNFRILTFNQKMKAVFKKYLDVAERMRNINEIFNMIDNYLGDSKVDRKYNGEVFTPMSLVNEMLDTLPTEVWSNPSLKWLDPANGVGNFPACIIQRLMIGLKNFKKNDDDRYKYILENMIFVCDISPKNMFIYKSIFDPNNEYNMNCHRGSFLEKGFDDLAWGHFDIVVGNPPYQEATKKGTGKTGGANLYTKFIEKIYSKFDNKFLLFVTPPTFMNTRNKKKKKIFTENQIHVLNMEECNRHFKSIGSKFCYFLLERIETYKDTKVICEYNKNVYRSDMNLKEYDYLPLLLDKNAVSIYDKTTNSENFDMNVIYTFDHRKKFISTSETKEFCYPLMRTAKQMRYSSKEHPAQQNRKVMFSLSGDLCPVYDDGILGMTDGIMWINVKDEEEGNYLINYFDKKLVKFILKIHKFSGFTDINILKKLPSVELVKNYTDEEIYNMFTLTQEEIDLIEINVK